MFAASMRPQFPQLGPSLAQKEWFPQVAHDELSELDRLEKNLEAQRELIRNMDSPSPMGLNGPAGEKAQQQMREVEEVEIETEEEDEAASLEDSIDFDGSVDTVDLDEVEEIN